MNQSLNMGTKHGKGSQLYKSQISHSYVSAFLRGDRPAGNKILKCLKMKKVVRYLVKGQSVVMKFEDITN